MSSFPQIQMDNIFSIELLREDRRVLLAISLGEPFTGGNLIVLAPDFTMAIQGADETSSQYTLANWLSGILSGSFFAFRRLKIQRRQVVLNRLEGCLGREDMDGVAAAAALAIAKGFSKDESFLDLGAWRVGRLEFQAIDHEPGKNGQAQIPATKLHSTSNLELQHLLGAYEHQLDGRTTKEEF